MKLKTKLTFAFLLVAFPVILLSYVGAQTNSHLASSFSMAKGDLIPSLQALSNLRFTVKSLADLDNRIQDLKVARVDSKTLSSLVKQVKNELKRYAEYQSTYLSVARRREIKPPFLDEFSVLSKSVFQYFKVRSQRYQLRGSVGESDSAGDKLNESFEAMVARASDYEISNFIKRDLSVADASLRSQRMFYFAVALCLLLAYFFSLVLASQLAKPIEKLTQAARNVDASNMFVFTGISQTDEVGELALAFESMLLSLQQSTVSTSYLESVFNSLPISLFVTDSSGSIVKTNKTAQSLLNAKEDILIGKEISSIFKDSTRLASELGEIKSDETIERGLETFLIYEDVEIPVILTMRTLIADDALETEFLFAALDLSATVAIKRERDAYREQLQQSSQMAALGTMSAILAHKLSQPLTAVRLFLQQLRREAGDSTGKLEQSLSELKRVEGAVKDVLRFSRNAPTESFININLDETVQKVFLLLRGKAERNNVSLTSQGLHNLQKVRAAEGEIDELLFTLLENSIDAASDKPSAVVDIIGHKNGATDAVTFEIADNCGGVKEEHLDKIFDLFFTTKGMGEGTGLGLCIVKQIVDRLGGSISVANNEGVGTSFTVSLPAARMDDLEANV